MFQRLLYFILTVKIADDTLVQCCHIYPISSVVTLSFSVFPLRLAARLPTALACKRGKTCVCTKKKETTKMCFFKEKKTTDKH